jgi:hypothetical protein
VAYRLKLGARHRAGVAADEPIVTANLVPSTMRRLKLVSGQRARPNTRPNLSDTLMATPRHNVEHDGAAQRLLPSTASPAESSRRIASDRSMQVRPTSWSISAIIVAGTRT